MRRRLTRSQVGSSRIPRLEHLRYGILSGRRVEVLLSFFVRSNVEGHPDALDTAHRRVGATAVDSRHLSPALTTTRPFSVWSALNLNIHFVPMTFFSEGIEAEYTKSNTSCFSRLATSLSDTYFHLAACGDSIASFELVRNSYHLSLIHI